MTGRERGRELRRFWFRGCGRLLVEELFCGKCSECSWPAKGNSPPTGSWPCCRGVPAAVVTMTPSWSTDVVLVMAAWLEPAMAIDDDGPKPPGMGRAGMLTGCCLLGDTPGHTAQPAQGKGLGNPNWSAWKTGMDLPWDAPATLCHAPLEIMALYFP